MSKRKRKLHEQSERHFVYCKDCTELGGRPRNMDLLHVVRCSCVCASFCFVLGFFFLVGNGKDAACGVTPPRGMP